MDLQKLLLSSRAAEKAAHDVLAQHELSSSRVIHLEALTKSLSGTPVDVQDYFKEAITCLEQGLYRAGIVMAWAGHFNVFFEVLYQKHEADIRQERPKWKFRDLADLKESYAEAHMLEVAKVVKFINRAELRILDGQLSIRNQCAHPTLYRPSHNSAIGYVDEMISQTIKYIKP
ncbi:hypothetical protein [Spongiibacter marinus]|uniref:hypothetical protein n=1 Tax=Spongiibacter marinus TaxID=354246 RepID=UPI0035BE8ABF